MKLPIVFAVVAGSFTGVAAAPPAAKTAPAKVTAPLSAAKPEEAGMSSQRLERIGPVLRAEIDKGTMPGAVVAVARKGKLVYYEAFGYADKAKNVPMPKDAIFTIASMTKPLTTTGALMLYEEGRLLLNDPVGKYLPQLDNMQVARLGPDGRILGTEPARRKPTLQDLMRHTAGLTYGNRGDTELFQRYPQGSNDSADAMGSDEFLLKLGNLPLHYQPGSMWDYSLGLDVLGLTEEVITKQRLGEYLAQRVFQPLGMTDTAFVIPAATAARYAKALPTSPETGRPQAFRDPTQAFKFDCGGGCAFSTAMDYLRFAEMLRGHGKLGDTQILGRKTVEFMTADQLGPEVNIQKLRDYPNINGYGFGLSLAVRRTVGVPGIMGTPGDFHWGGANGTYFWVDPKEELAVVFMTATPGDLRIHFRQMITTLVLQAIAD
jgi:CubicO group peptidase (beta-lactamase class C family)